MIGIYYISCSIVTNRIEGHTTDQEVTSLLVGIVLSVWLSSIVKPIVVQCVVPRASSKIP